MHNEHFQSDFFKMASATHATLKTNHIYIFFGVEMLFKYQNNKQNLQIWDMQISQAAKF